MSPISSVALSGLLAQSKRLEVSASNVANLLSTGVQPGAEPQPGEFVPYQVALKSSAGGGVEAIAVPVSPPSVRTLAPGAPDADADGFAARPNVSLEREVVNQIDALRNFQANLKIIQTQDRMLGDLLDLVS